jgi:hypothetical protein
MASKNDQAASFWGKCIGCACSSALRLKLASPAAPCDTSQLQSDKHEDEERAYLSIDVDNGCLRSLRVGVFDSVPDVIWERSKVLSRLVQDCVKKGTGGWGSLPCCVEAFKDWGVVEAYGDQYDATQLCDTLDVRSAAP